MSKKNIGKSGSDHSIVSEPVVRRSVPERLTSLRKKKYRNVTKINGMYELCCSPARIFPNAVGQPCVCMRQICFPVFRFFLAFPKSQMQNYAKQKSACIDPKRTNLLKV